MCLTVQGGSSYSWNEAQFEDNRGPAWGLPCYEEGFVNEIDYFINRCIGAGEPPLSTLADAADALRIIEAAEQSVKLKKVIEIENCSLKAGIRRPEPSVRREPKYAGGDPINVEGFASRNPRIHLRG